MFIKYDEYDLLELFLSEPISLTDNLGDGEVRYVKSGENEFQLAINIYAYQLKCTISLLYQKKDIFFSSFENVTSLIKKGNTLEVLSGKGKLLAIEFTEDFIISIEHE